MNNLLITRFSTVCAGCCVAVLIVSLSLATSSCGTGDGDTAETAGTSGTGGAGSGGSAGGTGGSAGTVSNFTPPDDCYFDSGLDVRGGRRFVFCPLQKSWDEAEAYCESMSGISATLAILESCDDSEWLADRARKYKFLTQGNLPQVWIGLKRTGVAWQWSDGTPYSTSSACWNTADGQPTESGGTPSVPTDRAMAVISDTDPPVSGKWYAEPNDGGNNKIGIVCSE